MSKAFSVWLLNLSVGKGEQTLNFPISSQKPLGYLPQVLADIPEDLTSSMHEAAIPLLSKLKHFKYKIPLINSCFFCLPGLESLFN